MIGAFPFAMPVETWLLFVLVALAPAASPGPGMLFALSNSLRYGARATLVTGLVNGCGMTLMGLAVGLGLGALMAASALAFFILKLIGGAYLVWLGVKIWRDRSAFVVDPSRADGPPPYRKLAAQALAISLTNPKAAVLLAALLPPFMNVDAPAMGQVLILSATYGGLCALNHAAIAFSGAWLRRFLSSPRRAAAIRRATGGAFVGFGALLAASSR